MFQSLLDIVSCPVCFERLRPPTACCVNGHAVCNNCKQRLARCPKCCSKFSEEKHTTLSQILEALPFSCKYKDCAELTQDIDHHEKWCGYRPTTCRRCEWTGPAKKLQAHAERGHALQTNDVNNTHYMDRDFKWTYARVQHGQMFWDIRKHDLKKKTFSIQLIWVPNGQITEEKFSLTVEFQSKNSSLVATTKIEFHPGNSSDDYNCLIFHTDAFKQYTKKNDVSYKLRLVKE